GSDGWAIAVSTAGFTVETQTYFAQATDNEGLTSATASSTGEVVNSGGTETTTFASTDTPVSIPDRSTILSTLEILDDSTILDLNVQLSISHTRVADLEVHLTSPAGTRVELFSEVGGVGNDFQGTILDDEAGSVITSVAAPFNGTFRPQGDLSEFDGESTAGTWQLEVRDNRRKQLGTLNSWSIIVEYSPIPIAAAAPLSTPPAAETPVADAEFASGGDDD
ncbi:unnamed protein product, partial [marine sediment metagenome]